MRQPIFRIAVLMLLLSTGVSPSFSQTSAELKTFLSQRLGLSQDQIAAIQHGQPFATNAEPCNPAEIFVIGVVYINAAPESYVKFVSDPGNLRHLPFPEFLAIKEFQQSSAALGCQGFGLDSDDIKALRDCTPGKCEIQLPASTAMDELRKSVSWSAPNVDEQANHLLQKLVLSRLQDYQKEGSRIFGEVYNDKGQKVPVADQFKYMLSYYQVLPRDLPTFDKYIVDYPNPTLPNVQNTFRWERVNFGLKPTLFIIHVLTMRGEKPGEAAYVIADKQLYSSHYLETSLDLTFLIRGSDDPKQSGFYLVKTMACEQALLTGFKAPPLRVDGTADRVPAFACRIDEPGNEPISAGTAKGEGGVSKESVRRRSHFGPWKAQGGHANVFGGVITVRANSQLHLDRSSGRLSVGPEVYHGNSGLEVAN